MVKGGKLGRMMKKGGYGELSADMEILSLKVMECDEGQGKLFLCC